MAPAGFWAIASGKISFRRDGRWYNDDEPIDNARIAKLFSRCLRETADGRWQIAMADERAFVEVHDTPWVVTSVGGDAARGYTLRLNDDSEEPLDPGSLSVGEANVLYARVKDGRYRARFLRPAYYRIAPAIVERAGRFFLAAGGGEHAIGGAADADGDR
ncbi:MAG: hypothetical protein B6D46_12125 [Polyangiaceae bacterium UTPRO1]|jgi:hypothetical protein|nr:DUF1285 domain-containing protein [Myxococcales bacterium]OQY65971.1 MAG: hypothetical protein B6D46_12125 [Polyangiaceae bacterium UTPRO1]